MVMGSKAEDVMITIGIDYSAIQKKAKAARQSINKTFQSMRKQEIHASKSMKSIDSVISGINNKLPDTRVQFAGWAMSIMFFGMALQRIFSQIWKTSTKTFNDVMHSVEGSVTSFDMLEGSMKYLGFTVGQALEPVVAWLIPIIDSVSDWVSNNQTLAATLLTVTGILGTAFMVGGAGMLAVNGFAELGLKMGVLARNGDKLVAGGSLSKLGSFLTTPVGVGITAALLALVAVGAIAWKAFKETPEAWESIKESTKGLKPYITDIKDSFQELVNQVFPNLEVSWDSVAWFMAMGLANLVQLIKPVLTGFKNFVEILIVGVENLKTFASMMKSIMKGDFTGALNSFSSSAINTFNTFKNGFQSIMDEMSNSFDNIYTNVNSFKKDTLVSKGVGFSQNNIMDLWAKGALGGNELRALIMADTQKEDTLDNSTRKLVEGLYTQGLQEGKITIGNLNLTSDADTLQRLLYDLKANL